MKPDLSNVTLCAVSSTQLPLTARALNLSAIRCRFGDAMLLSHAAGEGAFRNVTIPQLTSRAAYSDFMLKRLAAFIQTDFVLVVQWDGYVLDPAAWTPEFCKYDYIGAKWHWHTDAMTVGNGGFSLRSKRLVDLLATLPLENPALLNEDVLICRHLRAKLEREHGIRFAPEALADRFSYERSMPEAPTFGFHGMGNLWRHVSDTEMLEMIPLLDGSAAGDPDFAELVGIYYQMRKFEPLRALFRRWCEWRTPAEIQALMNSTFGADIGAAAVACCQRICGADIR